MHHLTRRCEGAELDCEKMRRQLERALAEANAKAVEAQVRLRRAELDAQAQCMQREAKEVDDSDLGLLMRRHLKALLAPLRGAMASGKVD